MYWSGGIFWQSAKITGRPVWDSSFVQFYFTVWTNVDWKNRWLERRQNSIFIQFVAGNLHFFSWMRHFHINVQKPNVVGQRSTTEQKTGKRISPKEEEKNWSPFHARQSGRLCSHASHPEKFGNFNFKPFPRFSSNCLYRSLTSNKCTLHRFRWMI